MSEKGASLYTQYGCGFSAPKEWVNFDSSFTLKWEKTPLIGKLYTKNETRFPDNVRLGDIVSGLPVPDQSCKGVYASHVLEHLAFNDFHRALENTRKILQEGGIFRLLVPDLEWAAREYLRKMEAGDVNANSEFMAGSYLGEKERPRRLGAIIHKWLRTSAHLWMWDSLSMANALKEHGFKSVRPCAFGDCEDAMFALVEDPGRFEHAVAMEARA